LKVLEDCPGDLNFWYRHISKGAWPFSTADHGWPISDCTAEGLKVKCEQTICRLHLLTKFSDIYFIVQAVILLSKFASETVGKSVDVKRLYDAVHVILSLQVTIIYFALLVGS
jgi:cycloartenol synthase